MKKYEKMEKMIKLLSKRNKGKKERKRRKGKKEQIWMNFVAYFVYNGSIDGRQYVKIDSYKEIFELLVRVKI